MAYSHFRATVRGQHGSDTVQRHVREPPPPPPIGVAGAVGSNETVEIHDTVGEQWAVGLKGEALEKEAAEGKEQ